MIQRMNCVQNQIITHVKYLIRDKVTAFIITGGKDNVQHEAGELMMFWSELGFVFGKFPFVGWSRGWSFLNHNIVKHDFCRQIL